MEKKNFKQLFKHNDFREQTARAAYYKIFTLWASIFSTLKMHILFKKEKTGSSNESIQKLLIEIKAVEDLEFWFSRAITQINQSEIKRRVHLQDKEDLILKSLEFEYACDPIP